MLARVARGGLRPLRGAAAFSAGARPPPPRQKTAEDAKAERESEYPFMLVNPRTAMGDAAPVFMIAALYFLYCVGADVSDALFPAPLPMLMDLDDGAADELKVPPHWTPDGWPAPHPLAPHATVTGAARWARAHEGRQYSPAEPRRGRSLIRSLFWVANRLARAPLACAASISATYHQALRPDARQ